jgi:hypothetical protein
MCADNDMSDQSYVDLAEMTRVGSTPDVNIVVQVDRAMFDSLPQPRRYYVEKNRLQLLGELAELDMADPANLADFVRYGKDNYPADNYLLVLWDHGNGWPESLQQCGRGRDPNRRDSGSCPRITLDTQGSSALAIMTDWSSGRALGVAGGGLKAAMDGVRSVLGKKVAILGLDACLMQMLEVAYEVKDDAGILVSTEDLMPFNGFPYDAFFQTLVDRSSASPADYARQLPDLFVNSYSRGSQGDQAVTLSALDLTRLDGAVQSLDQWLKAVACRAPEDPFPLARRLVQTFSCEYVPATRFDDNVDLIHLLTLSLTPGAKTDNQKARTAFESVVLACANNDPALANSRGIAVWFPDFYLALKMRHEEYFRLGFAQNSAWLHFLNCFFNYDDIKPLAVTLAATPPGRRNDFELYWSRSFDLAPVAYDIYEITDARPVFSDPTEGLDNWINQGFVATDFQDRPAFCSGISPFRDSTLTLREPLSIEDGALLCFSFWVNTREIEDTLGNFSRDVGYIEAAWDTESVRSGEFGVGNPGHSVLSTPHSPLNWFPVDSFYGYHPVWTDCRYLIPRAGGMTRIENPKSKIRNPKSLAPERASLLLRFRIKAGSGPNVNGFYVSTVAVQSLSDLRVIIQPSTPNTQSPDTAKPIFNHLRGNCSYFVVPRDSFGNIGFVSSPTSVAIGGYAEPYTIPAPIQSRIATLVCDYPEGEQAEASIFTLSGELVNRFPVTASRMSFPAVNQQGRDLASGIYLVVIKTQHFHAIGRIAIAR